MKVGDLVVYSGNSRGEIISKELLGKVFRIKEIKSQDSVELVGGPFNVLMANLTPAKNHLIGKYCNFLNQK